MLDTEFSNLRRRINVSYYALYVMYILLVVIFGYLLKPVEKGIVIDPFSQKGEMIAYIVIFYVIVSIPGALWFFKCAMKRTVSKIENEEEKQRSYLSYATMRVFAIGFGAILSIPAYYMLGGYQPMIWCAAIAIVAQFFCKPSDRKIYLEMNNKNEEDL